MASAGKIADALGGSAAGNGWMCLCPAHADKNPSLSVADGQNGKVLLKCFAGCSLDAVIKALRDRGLWASGGSRDGAPAVITKRYDYRDASGVVVYTKVKTPQKKFWIEVPKGSPPRKALPGVLYNLPGIRAAQDDGIVIVTEGEKDADTLIGMGFCATTSDYGAGKWPDSYSATLQGFDVVLCGDSDPPGRQHVALVGQRLTGIAASVRYVNLPAELDGKTVKDVSDWVQAGGTRDGFLELMQAASETAPSITEGTGTPDPRASGLEGKTRPHKKYQDYADLFAEVFSPKRCLLSEELMTFDRRLGKWVPVANRIGRIESYCRDNFKEGWSAAAVDCHFRRYEGEKVPEPLLDATPWDNVDRVKQLCSSLQCANFTHNQVTELVKDWGAKMMRRINDPHVRNRILVLKGPQEIGKDWWLDALIGGFAPARYVKNLSVGQDREALRMLHKAVVFKIAEFDRATNKIEVGLLKHLITAPDTDERLPYARAEESRVVRASFVATANVDDILRDTTGGTRFIILDVGKIRFDYPGSNTDPDGESCRAQVLAQFKWLADCGFKSSVEVEEDNRDYITARTPQSTDEMIRDSFFAVVLGRHRDKVKHFSGREGREGLGIAKTDADEILAVIARDEKLGLRHVKAALFRCGLDDRNMYCRFWRVFEDVMEPSRHESRHELF